MSNHLSDRVKNMATSATLAMAAKARELRNEGKNIIGLSLGEPDFNIPEFIKDAAKEAIDQNYSSYSPVDGYGDLKQAIATKFKRDNSLTYSTNQIVVSTGAKQSLANIAMVMLNEGDEVILPAPFWVSYSDIVKLTGGVPVQVSTSISTDFKMTPEQLEAAITPRTKMMWFSSPCNPSGSVYSKEELEGLAEVLKKHPKIFVVSDEIYEHINFVGGHVSIAGIDGPEWIAKACTKFQGQITSGANAIGQRSTIAALEAPVSKIQFMIDEFHKRRDLILQLLGEIDGFKLNIPEGAFYVFPDVTAFFGRTLNGVSINNASDFSMYLLEHANVATVTGEAFGNPNCIRISYAASEKELREAITRIKAVL